METSDVFIAIAKIACACVLVLIFRALVGYPRWRVWAAHQSGLADLQQTKNEQQIMKRQVKAGNGFLGARRLPASTRRPGNHPGHFPSCTAKEALEHAFNGTFDGKVKKVLWLQWLNRRVS